MLSHRRVAAAIATGLILGNCIPPCLALERGDLTFYAPFEGSLTAQVAAGKPEPVGERTPTVEYVPGVVGQAVVTGTTLEDLVTYPVAGHLNERRGAVSLWFKPMNWRSGDAQQHPILSIGGRLLFYHYWESNAFSFYWMSGSSVLWGPGYMYTSASPEQWQHVVASWADGTCTVYWNGKEQATAMDMPAAVPAWADGGTFCLAPPDWTRDRNNKTSIDELMVFSNPLSAQEARSLYRHATVDLPPPSLRVSVADSATVTDFVDGLFGNLTRRRVTATIGRNATGLTFGMESETGADGASTEVWLALPGEGADLHRIRVDAVGQAQHLVLSAAGTETNADASTLAVQRRASAAGLVCELQVPWQALGHNGLPPAELRLNLVRRWSVAPSDCVSWADISRTPTGPQDPRAWGRLLLTDAGPVLSLRQLGALHYAKLDIQGEFLGGNAQQVQAEIRLRPSDFREIVDPVTFVKTYTGTELALDQALALVEGRGTLQLRAAFSDTDINSLLLSVSDETGMIYAAQRPFVALPPVAATVHPFPRAGRLEVHADTRDYHEAPLARLSVETEVLNRDGVRLAQAAAAQLEAPQVVLTVPLAPLPVGQHTVRTTLRQDGVPVSSFDAVFAKPAPGPWEGTQLGRDELVVPPFTPVQVEGQSVAVWGRTYQWRDSLFPVQISSAGEDLLAGPVELLLLAAATDATAPTGQATPATVRVVEQSAARAVVECSGTLGDLVVQARHLIEYDGMCLTRLQISGAGELPGLTLVIPLKAGQSTLYQHFLNAGLVRGTTVHGRGVDLKGQADVGFRNTLWLGNEDRGVTWFAESLAGWRLQPKGPSELSVRARPQDTLLLVRLANAPVAPPQALDVTFGVIATPVKKLPDHWRFQRARREWAYTWCGPGGFTQSNNDITHVLPGWKAILAEQLKRVPLYVPYQRPDWINLKVPEATYYRDEWQSIPPYLAGSDDGSANSHLSVCLGSTWQDFLLYHTMQAYDDNGMVGFYFDGALPQRCKNPAHGHGWTDSQGNLQTTYPMLAYREFYKRLALECSKRGRPYLLWVHCSNCLELPTLSFCDMTWDGEQFSTAATAARDYAKLFTLAYFRAEFLGQPFGLPVQWLVEFFNQPGKEPMGEKEIDTVLLFALVHGVGDHVLASNIPTPALQDYVLRVLNAQDAFGVREPDTEFLPYWRNTDSVALEPRDDSLACSVWKRPGKALLIVANAQPEARQATVQLDPGKLGLDGATQATDLVGGASHPLRDGALRLDLPPSTWRALVVQGGR